MSGDFPAYFQACNFQKVKTEELFSWNSEGHKWPTAGLKQFSNISRMAPRSPQDHTVAAKKPEISGASKIKPMWLIRLASSVSANYSDCDCY